MDKARYNEILRKSVLKYFDSHGNLLERQDPFRNDKTEFYATFFDEDGFLHDHISAVFAEFLEEVDPRSDLAAIYHVDRFAGSIGGYSTVYLWKSVLYA